MERAKLMIECVLDGRQDDLLEIAVKFGGIGSMWWMLKEEHQQLCPGTDV